MKDTSHGTIRRYYAFCFVKQMAFFSAVLVPFFTEWGRISLASAQFLQSWFMLWLFVLDPTVTRIRRYRMTTGSKVVYYTFWIDATARVARILTNEED